MRTQHLLDNKTQNVDPNTPLGSSGGPSDSPREFEVGCRGKNMTSYGLNEAQIYSTYEFGIMIPDTKWAFPQLVIRKAQSIFAG